MESLKQTVIKARGIKESSWKTYARYIDEMAFKVTGDGFINSEFLKEKAKVEALLDTFGDSKRRVALSVILVVLSPDKKMAPAKGKDGKVWFPGTTPLYKYYYKRQKALQQAYNTKMESQTKSEKQAKNWVEWPDVLKLQRSYMNKIRRDKYSKKEVLTKQEMKTLQDYLIISLYTLIKPRRLDFAGMKVMGVKQYSKLADKQEHNVLVINGKVKKVFKFGASAQKNENGGQSIYSLPVPANLNRVLQLYFKFHKQPFLLFNSRRSGEITKDGLSKQIMALMNNKFPGKSIGASLLRTIFSTHFNKDGKSIKEKKAAAEEMGHSSGVAEVHYTKKD
tara:strand:- start:4967 stop:5974 length:1008 start_codon:yes stop_codon:yes gene_type:complete